LIFASAGEAGPKLNARNTPSHVKRRMFFLSANGLQKAIYAHSCACQCFCEWFATKASATHGSAIPKGRGTRGMKEIGSESALGRVPLNRSHLSDNGQAFFPCVTAFFAHPAGRAAPEGACSVPLAVCPPARYQAAPRRALRSIRNLSNSGRLAAPSARAR